MSSQQKSSNPEHDQQQATAAERRRAPRFPADLETNCRPALARDGVSWPGRVLDISQNGIALVMSRRFEPGSLLTMDLEDHERTVSRSVFARVIHVRALDAGGWRHGCAFTSALSDDELQAFRAQRVQPGPEDCRAWVRFECDVPTLCREAEGSDSQPTSGRILNISPGGIALLVSTPWPKGTLVWLQLQATPQRPSRSVLVRVAHEAKPVGEDWLLGCEFAFQIAEEDLQRLLR